MPDINFMKYFPIVFAIIFVVIIIIIIMTIVRNIRRSISRTLGNVNRIMDAVKAADDEQMYTPKSLSGVESIHLRNIMRDFPEFNPSLAKSYIKSFITEYFAAMAMHKTDLACFEDTCSRQFIELMSSEFSSPIQTYSQVKVHKVVISDYKKMGDEAEVMFQLALQYVPSRTGRLSQEKYTVSYSYFLESGAQGEMASLICQHCGAPISSLGVKVCPYCDSAVAGVAMDRAWKITDVKKTTY